MTQSPLLEQLDHFAAGQPRLEHHYAQPPHELIATLNAEHVADRLARLEKSLQQLEYINSATLALLQKVFESGEQIK